MGVRTTRKFRKRVGRMASGGVPAESGPVPFGGPGPDVLSDPAFLSGSLANHRQRFREVRR